MRAVGDIKWCPKCRTFKSVEDFGKSNQNPDGLYGWCRRCHKAAKKLTPSYKYSPKRYSEKERDYRLSAWAFYKAANPEKVRETMRKVRIKRIGKQRVYNLERRDYVRQATPKWVNKNALADVYYAASYLTRLTQIQFSIDHEIPLRGINVCGLHIPANLRIIPLADNQQKGNRLAA